MTTLKYSVLLLLPLLLFISCNNTGIRKAEPSGAEVAYHTGSQFNEFWYDNEAELSRYKLTQARYGEVREGDAVMIFVTEHLHPRSLVKTANEDNKGIPVIKLNFTRSFTTGIYPYSLMTSVFTPVNRQENPHTLKVSFTGQEWCGHVFEMLKLTGSGFDVHMHSYFEGEADKYYSVDAAVTEDELWNLIRIDPTALPLGSISLLPPLYFVRLMHKELKIYEAEATLADTAIDNKPLQQYSIYYPGLEREVNIFFEDTFPHKVVRWNESYKSGFGARAETLTTEAELIETIMLDYWNKNTLADTIYREKLGY